MEINYELKTEDFYQFSKENAPAESTHKPMVILYLILYLTFILADVIYILLTGWNNWNPVTLLLSIFIRTIFCLVSVFVIVALFKRVAVKKAEDILSKQGQNGAFCEHRIIINEKELIELTDVNTARYSWKTIGEIKEFENFVTIEVVMSSSYVIPKRCFEDRQHLKNFIETAKQYRQNAENSFQLSHLLEYEKSLE